MMSFKKFSFLTLLVVLFLVLVGGIVRSTGAGMGCPDWPKCFGLWIPPISVDELPLNYQEIYGAKLKGEVIFNAQKTWIEYLNRLLGVLTGLFVLITAVWSIKYYRINKKITFFAVASFILTLVQGGIGAKVVSSELAHYMIHIHLVIALFILFLIIFCWLENFNLNDNISKNKNLFLLLLVLLVSILQFIFGTQVRSSIDDINKLLGENLRNQWIDNLGLSFYIHRSFSLIVLILNLIFLNKSSDFLNSLNYIFPFKKVTFSLIVLSILSGVVLTYAGFPAFIQPIHLILAVLLICNWVAVTYISLKF